MDFCCCCRFDSCACWLPNFERATVFDFCIETTPTVYSAIFFIYLFLRLLFAYREHGEQSLKRVWKPVLIRAPRCFRRCSRRCTLYVLAFHERQQSTMKWEKKNVMEPKQSEMFARLSRTYGLLVASNVAQDLHMYINESMRHDDCLD